MFLEPYYIGQRRGWIEVICGCMFSGKTEELIRRLKRSQIGRQKVKVFKSGTDVRYHKQNVVSHDENSLDAIPVQDSHQLLEYKKDLDVIGIDEAQFFDDGLTEVVNTLASNGIRVIIAGLDMDYMGKPFSPMPEIMATAEFVTKVHAICVHCGNLATHSYRISLEEERILLGEKNTYEARCRKCFHAGPLLDFKSGPGVKADEEMRQGTLFQEE